MSNITYMKCQNCNKDLRGGDKDMAEKIGVSECAECRFHEHNGTRTIPEYNAWLRGEK